MPYELLCSELSQFSLGSIIFDSSIDLRSGIKSRSVLQPRFKAPGINLRYKESNAIPALRIHCEQAQDAAAVPPGHATLQNFRSEGQDIRGLGHDTKGWRASPHSTTTYPLETL